MATVVGRRPSTGGSTCSRRNRPHRTPRAGQTRPCLDDYTRKGVTARKTPYKAVSWRGPPDAPVDGPAPGRLARPQVDSRPQRADPRRAPIPGGPRWPPPQGRPLRGRQHAPTAHVFAIEAFGSIRSSALRARAFAAYPPSLRSVRYSTVPCTPGSLPGGTSSAFNGKKT